MTTQSMFVKETERQIKTLGATTVLLSLLSIKAPSIPSIILERAVESVADSLDLVGPVGDGSLGLLSVWPDGRTDIKERYVLRLQSVLCPLARRREIGPVHIRFTTHWANETTDAYDLFDCLFDTSPTILALPRPEPVLRIGPLPFSWYASANSRGVRA